MAAQLHSSKGQITVELMLITVVLVALFGLISRTLDSSNFFVRMIQSPWTNEMAGMIENGVWGRAADTRPEHPNNISRHSSLDGVTAQ